MSQDIQVVRSEVKITNPLGLHLRPADKFVKLASSFPETEVKVRLRDGDRESNGKSILDLAMLAAECDTVLELEARGPQAAEAIKALAELVQAKFHEGDDGEDQGP